MNRPLFRSPLFATATILAASLSTGCLRQGDECVTDEDCGGDRTVLVCIDKVCVSPPPGVQQDGGQGQADATPAPECTVDNDCGAGQRCVSNRCGSNVRWHYASVPTDARNDAFFCNAAWPTGVNTFDKSWDSRPVGGWCGPVFVPGLSDRVFLDASRNATSCDTGANANCAGWFAFEWNPDSIEVNGAVVMRPTKQNFDTVGGRGYSVFVNR